MTTGDRTKRWALFEQKLRERGLSKASIPKAPRGEPIRASFAQSRLWFLEQLTPGSAAYNDHYALRVRGPLDVAILRRVLDEIVLRHETLRTTFVVGPDGEALQLVHPAGELPLTQSSRAGDAAASESWVLEEAAAEARTPFDLSAGPVARARLLELGPRERVLLFTIHHIASDGWSMGVLAREITTLYGAFAAGRPSPLPAIETQYADYAQWQRETLRGETLEREVAFWKGELEGVSASIDLPADRSRPPVQTFSGATIRRRLESGLSAGVDALAKELGATPFAVLFAAFNVLLSRYSAQRDLVVATPSANRTRLELEGLIGCFVNTLACRTDLSGEPTFAALVTQVSDRMVRAQAHQDLPFETLVDALAVERDMSRSPIAQVMFVLQNAPPAVLEIAGLTFAPFAVDAGFAKLDLTLDVMQTPEGYLPSWEYNTDLFDDTTVRRMVEHYEHQLGQMLAAPHVPVFRLDPLPPGERRRVLQEFNATGAPCPRHGAIHRLFVEQAGKTPGAVALVAGTTRVTYAELGARAGAIARALRERGVGPGGSVGVLLPRDETLVPSLLGVLMTGAMYVPLDPTYPSDRLAFILGDADPPWVLVSDHSRALVPGPFADRCIDVTTIAPDDAPPAAAIDDGGVGGDDRAYLIYTSGSTGKPKGVVLTHGNAVALIAWAQSVYGPEERRGVLASASVCFDVSVYEFFFTLASGGMIILAENALALPMLPAANEVTLLTTVPSAGAELLRSGSIPSSVRTVNLCAEPLPEELALGVYTLPHVERLYNLYGPSETTTYSTYALVTRGSWRPTVGRPISNTQGYVLDEYGQPVPVGVRGELYLAGFGVARGYLNRDELTASRFLADPFSDVPGARMYKTGDVVRWTLAGDLEFLGRNDHQVKIRGFRIELGEIDTVLRKQPEVKESIVVVREDVPGTKRVTAYVVPADGQELVPSRLRAALAGTLPEYMVPADFVVLEVLPLSSNGKVDRKRLPAPDREQGATYVAPRTPAEAALARVWQDVLRGPRVSAHDSFFELGGDSILAMRMSALARREGLQITVRQIFELRTLERLAEHVAATSPLAVGEELPRGPFALSPVQRWFFERKLANPHHYNQSLLLQLRPGTRLDVLGRAVTSALGRHPSLRLRFEPDTAGTGAWRQSYGADARVAVRAVDLSAQGAGQRGIAIDALTHELEASIDFLKGPIGHVALVDAGDREAGALFIVLHHLVVDVVSWHVVMGDIATIYARLVEGKEPPAAAPGVSYARYVERLAQYAASPAARTALDAWTQAPTAVPGVPRDVHDGANVTSSKDTLTWTRDAATTNALTARGRELYDLGVDELILAALARSIGAWSGGTVAIDLERHGRDLPFADLDPSDSVGWFTTIVPIFLDPFAGDARAALLAAKEAVRGLPDHGLPFGVLRYWGDAATRAQLEALPEREIVYNFLGTVADGTEGSALFGRVRDHAAATNHAPGNARSHLLEVTGAIRNGELRVELTFSRNVHARTTIARLVARFDRELSALAEHLHHATVGAYSPSDFPLAKLRQVELDAHHGSWHGRVEDVYALTPAQHAILVDVLRDPVAGVYLPQLHAIVGALDPATLERSLRWVLARHPALRTSFVWRGVERPVQVVFAEVAVPVIHDDWRGSDEPTRRQRLGRFLADDRERGFELDRAPLLRLMHARWNDDEDILVWTIHHAISDGWSLPRIIGEVLAAYSAFQAGEAPTASRPPPFRDYVAWLARQDDVRGAAYWRAKLDGATPLDIGIAEDPSYRNVQDRRETIAAETANQLEPLARRHGVTVGTVLQAAWAVVLARYSGKGDVVFGSVDSGRPVDLEGVDAIIGMFVTTLPLRVTVDDRQPLASLLGDVQRATLELREHAHTALAQIARATGARALFDSICVIENYPSLSEGAGASLRVRDVGTAEVTRFPLTVSAVPREDITLHVSASLTDPGAAAELLAAWRQVIEQMAREPDALVGALVLAGAAQHRAAVTYWNAQLEGATVTVLPTDRSRVARSGPPAAPKTVVTELGGELSRAVDALGRACGASQPGVLLAVFAVLLARYTAQADVVVMVDLDGGALAPIRVTAGEEVTFHALAGVIDAALRGAREHRAPGALSRPALSAIGFAFSDGSEQEPLRAALGLEAALRVQHMADDYRLALDFDEGLFDPSSAARMSEHLKSLVAAVAREPASPLWHIVLAPAVAPAGQSSAAVASASGASVLSLFAAHARATPEAVAVWAGDVPLTYAQLDARSSGVARRLAELGVVRGDLVAVHLGRSPLLIVVILGALKAGAAYVPIDATTPGERVSYMLQDSAARVVVTEDTSTLVAPGVVRARDLVALEAQPATVTAASGDLAYVIYTSGSTGHPKGVAVEHGSLLNYVVFYGRVTGVGAGDRILQFASPSFDVSVEEIFGALCHGAALVLRADDVDPGVLLDAASALGVSVIGLPTAYWNEMTRVLGDGAAFPESVRIVLVGGERLSRDVLAQWRRHASPRVRLLNMYGPTEATISATYAELTEESAGEPPIGRPVDNAIVFVADAHGRPLPVGVPGELLVGGAVLARGYLRRPELTAERFTPSAFVAGRVYHTGDLVRWRDDRQLEYLGRIDHQVKIRGFRVELGEIEAALRSHPRVDDAVAVIRDDGTPHVRIVAYVAGTAVASDLRDHVRDLPSYMLPSAIVILDRLPLTRSGKVDRRALPEPERAADEAAHVAPRTVLEASLADVWQRVLRVERVGVRDNFFELGGHSLLAIQIVSRIGGALGLDVSVREVFEAPTVEGLAERLRDRVGGSETARIARRGLRSAPLSFAQARLWFLDQLEPGSAAYNMPGALRVSGKLDVGSLERALGDVLQRHEVLRTVFAPGAGGGEPVQIVRDAGGFVLSCITAPNTGDAEAWVDEQLRADATTPFDLARGPLLRSRLLKLDDENHVLLFNMHHIVSDGRSIDVFVTELATLYAAYAAGRAPALRELPVQYADYAMWQRERLTRAELERQLAFWRAQLEGVPPYLDLPGKTRPAIQTYAGATRRSVLDTALRGRIEGLAIELGATPFMLLLAAFAVLLGRSSRQSDLVIGIPIANRRTMAIEDSIGLFVNTLAIRADLRLDPTFDGLVAQLRERLLGAHAHHDLPFEKLVDSLKLERDTARTPIFQTMFAMQDAAPAAVVDLPGLTLAPLASSSDVAKFELTLDVAPTVDGYVASWEYRTDVFEAAFIERLTHQFERLLRAAVARPDEPCWRLPVLAEVERRTILVDWNDTAAHYPGELVHELVALQAQRTPDAVAVVDETETLTYRELERRVLRLAMRLRTAGARVDGRIAIALPRSVNTVVALLGIQNAGAAYVPVDLTQPQNRVRDILEDARVELVLTQRALVARLPLVPGVESICLDDPPADGESDDAPSTIAWPQRPADALAYVMFTSGSTGRPKGVEISHRALVNFLWSMRKEPGIVASDVVLALTNLSFDIAGLELYLPLLVGASVFVASREVATDGRLLSAVLESRAITVLQATPPTYTMLLASGWRGAPGLKLLVGGEALAADLAERLLGCCASLWNVYGPTETTVWSTCARLVTSDVTIGKPIANTLTYVLDDHLQPVPAGVLGELYIGGDGLARGYSGRPELTAERFMANPYGRGRIYRTGDIARYRDDGTLECLGRADHQVKVRGFRIELGDIETALRKAPAVVDAVVHVDDDGARDKRLVAYVVSRPSGSAGALRTFLADWLPDYMIPGLYVFLDCLPLTANGKIDRKALPRPERAIDEGFVAPRDDRERAVAAIFGSVLEVERVGAFDDFFTLGGHSLLATELAARLREAFATDLPLKSIFEGPTVAALARLLSAPGSDPSLRNVVTVRQGTGTPWICFPALAGTVTPYLQVAAVAGPPVFALQAAGLDADADGRRPDADVDAIAADFAAAVARVAPEGPLRLLGWSFGAVTAFACARLLAAGGRVIEELVLLDPPFSQAQAAVTRDHLAAAFVLDAAASVGRESELLPHLADLASAGVGESPDEESAHAAQREAMWVLARDLGIFPGAALRHFDNRLSVYSANMGALSGFVPSRSYEGKTRILGARDGNGADVAPWLRYLPDATSMIVDATHYSILQRLPDLLR